jgi:hypothetical protein
MSNPYLILWCDPTKNKIYSGWQINTEALTPILKQGDEIGVELHWVTKSSVGTSMDEVEFPPSADITLAIGRLDAMPTDGTFTLTYDGDTTGELAYDITAAQLETALNDLDSIDSEGGVSVSKVGNFFRIVWAVRFVGSNPFSANTDALSPTSESNFVESKVGSATANRIVLFKIRQSVVAGTTSFVATSPPQITITNVFSNVWRVSIYPTPKDGVFTLSFGGGISPTKTSPVLTLSDSPTQMVDKLATMGIGTFTVTSVGAYSWDISVPPLATVVTAANGVIGFSSMYGVLNMNTAEVEELLASSESERAKLEVEISAGGEIQTLIQTEVIIINDLIQTSSFEVVDLGQVMPVDSVVRYDTSQALTAPQQLQARDNIDAASQADLDTAETDIAALEGQFAANIDQPVLTTSDVTFNSVTVGTATVIIDNDGITFPDDTVQTTAYIAGSSNPFDQDLNTTDSVVFDSVGFANATSLAEGTFDNGMGGANGISLNCAVGYELNWQAGRLCSTTDGGATKTDIFLNSNLNFDEDTALGITFGDTTTQTTAAVFFDQDLNTTDSPAFVDLDISGQITLSGFGGAAIGPLAYSASDGVITTEYSATGITFADTTVQESAPVFSSGTSIHGGGGGHIDKNSYPDEITIVIGGVTYAMPAREV